MDIFSKNLFPLKDYKSGPPVSFIYYGALHLSVHLPDYFYKYCAALPL